jgi:hypothetical protein
MSAETTVELARVAVAAPRVILLDARTDGLDEAGLRARAREVAAANEAGYSSRSYRFPLALVACHERHVGVDIERVERCSREFADSIRTPAEREAGWPGEDADRFFTSLWSSKEALAKALGDALSYDPRRLEGPTAWPDGRCGPWSARPLELGAEHVGWVCWRRHGQPDPTAAPVAR